MLKVKIVLALLCLVLAVPVFAQDAPTVGVAESDSGPYLVGPNGMTLYIFTRDSLDTSVCTERCLENWPALTVESADALTTDEAIPGEFGTITREDDGTMQVTYNGMPLYYWARDAAPGDMTGEGVGGVWWVVPPATVAISKTDVGQTLVGPTGMTVYIFTNDEPGVSNCADQCLANWPALTVASEDELVLGNNLHGELGTITREDDGTMQVTYNGWPLYYWKDDAARGDATGEGVGDVWYTLAPETVVVSESGEYLVAGAGGKTLYTFDNDEAGVSNCSGDCLTAWPALVGEADRVVGGAGVEGELGTITRDDGSVQVTYNGWPLYFFAEDAAPGDTNGDGVGEVWHLVAP